MATGIIALITTLLTTITPLLVKFGLWIIDKYTADQAMKTQAQNDFLNSIADHLTDFSKSVNAHNSYQDQVNDLNKTPPPVSNSSQPDPDKITPGPREM